MFKFFRSKAGFTLVELMIVAIIVAILAAVAIPLMSGNKRRAYATEAEAALGNIRSSLRSYFAEHDVYPTIAAGTLVEGNVPGIVTGDLTGTFFSGPNYTIESDDTTFTITCTWTAEGNTVPRAGEVSGITATTTLDQDGVFARTGY